MIGNLTVMDHLPSNNIDLQAIKEAFRNYLHITTTPPLIK